MNFFILHEDPRESAALFFNKAGAKYAFKMLIELGQLICSAGYSTAYKAIPQGKELQMFLQAYPDYGLKYFDTLKDLCYKSDLQIKPETKDNLHSILCDFMFNQGKQIKPPTHIYFRCENGYNSDTSVLLPIKEGIKKYNKYLDWKKEIGKI